MKASNSNLLDRRLVRLFILLLPSFAAIGPAVSLSIGFGAVPIYRLAYLPAALLFFVIWTQHGRRPFATSRIMFVLGVLIAIIGLLLIVSSGSGAYAGHFLLVGELVLAWLVAAAVTSDERLRDTILRGWLLALLLVAVLTILNALGLYQRPPAINELAQRLNDAGVTGNVVGYPGPFGNPNDLGGFVVASAPLAYLAAKRWGRRPWLVGLAIVLPVVLVSLSLSRMAGVGLLIVAWVFIAVRRMSVPGRLPVFVAATVYLTALLATAVNLFSQFNLSRVPLMGEIFTQISEGSAGDALRLSTWQTLLSRSLSDYPQGAGPGAYERLSAEFAYVITSNAHNVFVEVLFEYGIVVGFLGLIWASLVAVNMWRMARAASSLSASATVAAGSAALVGLAAWGLVSSSLISAGPWGMILGTGLGLISTVPLVQGSKSVAVPTRNSWESSSQSL